MKKLFIGIILVICVFIPCLSFATTLKGGVEKVWTVESAKEEVFKDAKSYVALSNYPAIDPNFNENKELINKNQLNSKGRKITIYSNDWYGIVYDDMVTEEYHYNAEGKLLAVDFSIPAKNIYTRDDLKKYPKESLYPAKCYKHIYPSGKIASISLIVKEGESYVFKPSGELLGHWIGTKCYDANNNLIMTRGSD